MVMKKRVCWFTVLSASIFLTLVTVCPVDAVLQSRSHEDHTESPRSEIVPSTDQAATDSVSSDAEDSTSKATIKMKLRPRSSVSKPAEGYDATPGVPAAYGARDESIFRSSNPHQVHPDSASPFVKRVGSEDAGYQRQPVLNYGKARGGSSSGSKFTVKQKPTPAK